MRGKTLVIISIWETFFGGGWYKKWYRGDTGKRKTRRKREKEQKRKRRNKRSKKKVRNSPYNPPRKGIFQIWYRLFLKACFVDSVGYKRKLTAKHKGQGG